MCLAGAPLVESTRNNLRLTMPLTAISATVVGVILSLALFFGQHVFIRPNGKWDWIAVALTSLACVAAFRFKVNTIALILVSGMAGAGLTLASLM